jgi:hypothetical protein
MSATVITLDGIKGRQQRMWASGDYAAVAARIHPMAERPLRGRAGRPAAVASAGV